MGWLVKGWIGSLTSHSTIFQLYLFVTAHRCAGGLQKKADIRPDSQRHRHFAGFLPGRNEVPPRNMLLGPGAGFPGTRGLIRHTPLYTPNTILRCFLHGSIYQCFITHMTQISSQSLQSLNHTHNFKILRYTKATFKIPLFESVFKRFPFTNKGSNACTDRAAIHILKSTGISKQSQGKIPRKFIYHMNISRSELIAIHL